MAGYLDYTFICKSWWYHGKRKIKTTDLLDLRMEPENKYDSTAVEITKNGRKIGYVPREYSRPTTEALRNGKRLRVSVIDESCSDSAPLLRVFDLEAPQQQRDDSSLTCIILLAFLGIYTLILGMLAASCIAILY